VYYDVIAWPERIVVVKAVGLKVRERVFVGREELKQAKGRLAAYAKMAREAPILLTSAGKPYVVMTRATTATRPRAQATPPSQGSLRHEARHAVAARLAV
jgi:hypothetical protein